MKFLMIVLSLVTVASTSFAETLECKDDTGRTIFTAVTDYRGRTMDLLFERAIRLNMRRGAPNAYLYYANPRDVLSLEKVDPIDGKTTFSSKTNPEVYIIVKDERTYELRASAYQSVSEAHSVPRTYSCSEY